MQPRDFQSAAMARVGSEFRAGKRAVLVVSPTGSGKTCMGAMMVARFVERGKRVAWGAHRGELLDQAARTLVSFGVEVGLRGVGRSAPVQLGTFQEWTSRGKAPDADVFVPDEAHHMGDRVGWQLIPKTYRDSGARIIGLTATPARADGRALPDFDAIVVAAQICELQERGLLVPLRWRGPSADQRLDARQIARSPVDAYRDEGEGRCAVVFAPNTNAATAYLTGFTDAGIRAKLVTGDMHPGERRVALEQHASGDVPVLVNVAVLTEGWDNPRCDCVIVARGCSSAALWIQMAGRGMRTCGKCETCQARNRGEDDRRPCLAKKNCLLLDLRGIAHDLGRPDAPAEYSLDGEGIVLSDRAPTNGIRLCKVCKAELPPGEFVCIDCGKDHSPPVPKAVDAPLTDWEEGWKATRDALAVSRPVAALAGILRKRRDSEIKGKPWKPGAAELRFSFIFKRRPHAQEMAAALNFVRSAEKFGATG